MIEFEKTILENGLRIITSPAQETKAMTLLFLVGAGSRYEKTAESGISHFLEHILFKGTKKYPSPLALAETLDGIGANFNAYTSQEFTGFYVQAEASHFDLALEVLTEMFYHPRYAVTDIDREKGVIVEEINMYRDLPQRHVYDLLFELFFGNSPMGRNIAGSKETVISFKKSNFQDYQGRFYTPDNIIVSVAGNPLKNNWKKRISTALSKKEGKKASSFEAVAGRSSTERVKIESRKTDQTHLVLAVPGLAETNDELPAISVMNTILGGTMSSRLFTEIREKRGLAYYVRSSHDSFHDTGILSIATGVRNANAKDAVKLILTELDRIRRKPVSKAELARAKDNFKGKLAISLEESTEVSGLLAQQELYYGRQFHPDQLVEQMESVTEKKIQAVADRLFDPVNYKLAAIGPFQESDFLKLIEK